MAYATVAAVVLFVGAYYQFRPEITITPQSALNPYDPFTSLFTVTNNGLIPAKNGQFWCHVRYMEDASLNKFTNINRSDKSQDFADLGAKDSTTVKCLLAVTNVGAFWTKADTEIVLSYRTAFSPVRSTKRARFVAVRDIQGVVRWTPLSLDSK